MFLPKEQSKDNAHILGRLDLVSTSELENMSAKYCTDRREIITKYRPTILTIITAKILVNEYPLHSVRNFSNY